ncbi:hypothetical protein ZTR_08571 [Talaromyces verruculosus]|nr:hypothetical protein ZTR_08571 [Talaromyces verruculosus]
MQTTAGSLCLLGAKPAREATIVDILRRAGAVLLGKTNMSEWANFRSDGDMATYGIKLTVGLTPRDGVMPGCPRQDTVGPIAGTVKDAAMILNVIAGKSPYDSATDQIPCSSIPDFTAKCSPLALENIRIGIPRNAMVKGNKAVETIFESVIIALKEVGAPVVDNTDFTDLETFKGLNRDLILLRDFKDSLDTFLKDLPVNPHGIRCLEDVIESTKSNAGECFPDRDLGLFEQAISSLPETSEEYQSMLAGLFTMPRRDSEIP